MNDLPGVLAAALEIQAFCEARRWRFCCIGGVAVQRWGHPRFTQDVDLTLLTGFGSEPAFLDTLLASYSGRRPDSREFALRHRVLLLRNGAGVDLDVALGALPFEERSVARSSLWAWRPGQSLRTCSAEDLIIHKVFAGRDRDWSDVESILIRQHGRLQWALILEELCPLLELKEDAESLPRLDRMSLKVRRRLDA
ncbi:MAG: hypothetical protein J0L84_08340 [Verrucomicrobia bacterium]|nr:hypothetical protein [Verrucomicrobiota bacterium]